MIPSRTVPMLLCGAALVVAGCADPAGLGESRSATQAASALSTAPLDLGTLGGPNSSAADINDAGVVVGSSEVAGEIHAFRWSRKTGMVDLGTVGGAFSTALEINRRGYVLGLSRDASWNLHIVLWTPENRLMDLGRPPGADDFSLAGFNNENQVVGNTGLNDLYTAHVFRWSSATGYVDLYPYRPHWETYVSAIDNDGSMAGTICCQPGAGMYGWWLMPRSTEFVSLGAPGGDLAWAAAMNDRHQVVGMDAGSGPNPNPFPRPYWTAPFVWTPGVGFRDLGTLGGWDGSANDINNLGEIIGGSTLVPFDQESPGTGFYYSDKLGMVRLPGFDGGLTGAGGINAYGKIAGSAQTGFGNWHAVVWNRPTAAIAAPAIKPMAVALPGGQFAQCLLRKETHRTRSGFAECLVNLPVGPNARLSPP